MPRRGIAVAVLVILASLIVLGLTSSFLVDWAWFSAVGYLDVFWTILGGKAALFLVVFAGSAVLLWVNGFLAHRFARRRGHVHRVDFEQIAAGVQTLPELLGLMGQRLPWRLLIAGVAVVVGILVSAGEVSNWSVLLRYVYQAPYGLSDPQYGKDIGFYLFSLPAYVALKNWLLLILVLSFFGAGGRGAVLTPSWDRDPPFGGTEITNDTGAKDYPSEGRLAGASQTARQCEPSLQNDGI